MNIVRAYYQNRRIIWIILIIIAFGIIILQILNNIAKTKQNEIADTNTYSNNSQDLGNVTGATSNKSGVTGEIVSKTELEDTEKVFSEFFGYCNKKELQKAYNMLTDECKELIYPSIEIFESDYYDNVFKNSEKIYKFENWHDNTYLVILSEESMSTGKVDNDKKQDYITIVDGKLNISSYIGRTVLNKKSSDNDIEIEFISKDTFMDSETYNVKIKNNTNKKICLDTAKKSKNIYIQDSNDVKYGVYNHELSEKKLVIQKGNTKELSLKFYSNYVSTKKIKSMGFSNVLLNYEKYLENKDSYNNYSSIEFAL